MGGEEGARGRCRPVQAQEVRHGRVPLPELAAARGARPHVHDSRRACKAPAHARVQRAVPDGVPLHGHAHTRHGKARAGRGRRAARRAEGPVRGARRGRRGVFRPRKDCRLLPRGDQGRHGRDGLFHRLAARVYDDRSRVQKICRVADRDAARDGARRAGLAPRRVVPKGPESGLAARHARRRRAGLYRVHARKVQAGGGRGRRRKGGRDPGRNASPRDAVWRDKPVGRPRRRVRQGGRLGRRRGRRRRGGGGRGVDRLGRVRAQARVPRQGGRAEGVGARRRPRRAHGIGARHRRVGAADPAGAVRQAGDGDGNGHVGARACAVRLARPRGPKGGRRRGGPRAGGARQDHRVQGVRRRRVPGGRGVQAARRQGPGRHRSS